MKARTVVILLLSILFVLNAFLFFQNKSYSNENRTLILKYDSIVSDNIHLRDSIGKKIKALAIQENRTRIR
jgi:hypothetical protein